MGAQLNENKICVGGDVVLFIMFISYIQQMNEQLMYVAKWKKNVHNNYTLGFAQ